MKGKSQIVIGDALSVLRRISDNYIDCCVTSPPYFGLRDYGVDGQIGLERTPEEYIDRLVEVFGEVRRTLRRDGTLWIIIADSYAKSDKGRCKDRNSNQNIATIESEGQVNSVLKARRACHGLKPKDMIGIPWMLAFALRADGWYLRSDIIWYKPNAMPESVKDRPTKCYEHVFMLAKSRRYYYDADAILVPAHYDGRKDTLNKGSSKYAEMIVPGNSPQSQHLAGKPHERWRFKDGEPVKNRRDVWRVSTCPFSGAHFATFPPELIEPCILAGSRPGGVVLDPFLGSGTTAMVAEKNGRDYIGIELNPKYIELARERLGGRENEYDKKL